MSNKVNGEFCLGVETSLQREYKVNDSRFLDYGREEKSFPDWQTYESCITWNEENECSGAKVETPL